MNQQIEELRKTKAFVLNAINGLNNEQLNAIPEGFANNIIWNVAHLIAAQQGVCYKRAGLPTVIEDAFFEAYKPGTHPEGTVSEEEVARIKELSLSTLDRFGADYDAGVFAGYTPWATRYGVELNSIEDAARFLLFHEGVHAGYILALKRAIALQPAMQ